MIYYKTKFRPNVCLHNPVTRPPLLTRGKEQQHGLAPGQSLSSCPILATLGGRELHFMYWWDHPGPQRLNCLLNTPRGRMRRVRSIWLQSQCFFHCTLLLSSGFQRSSFSRRLLQESDTSRTGTGKLFLERASQYFRLFEPYGLMTDLLIKCFCHCNTKAATGNIYMNEHGCVPIKNLFSLLTHALEILA